MKTNTAHGRRRTGVFAVFAMMLAAAAGPAAAVERGAYIALDYGKFRFDSSAVAFSDRLDPAIECLVPYLINNLNTQCSPRGDVSIDTSSMGRKSRGYDLWVGYQFSHWLAVEGAYLEMGKTHHVFGGTYVGDVDGDGFDDGPLLLEGRSSVRTRGAAFAAVGNLELGDYFSFDARAGFFFADNKRSTDATVALPDGPLSFSGSESDSKTVLFYGASANFWISPYYSVRGGIAVYSNGPFDSTVRHVKQYYLGIRYSYGY